MPRLIERLLKKLVQIEVEKCLLKMEKLKEELVPY